MNPVLKQIAADLARPGAKRDPGRLRRMLEDAQREIARLEGLINVPHTDEFLQAVRLEAAHQINRWGVEHDRGKDPPAWYWLVGYLAGKALAAALAGARDQELHLTALHHTISTAAVLLNWWRHMRGLELTYQPASDAAARLVDGGGA
jgi:ABC-type branched-subunit amino acid transport system substrate-binding protein